MVHTGKRRLKGSVNQVLQTPDTGQDTKEQNIGIHLRAEDWSDWKDWSRIVTGGFDHMPHTS